MSILPADVARCAGRIESAPVFAPDGHCIGTTHSPSDECLDCQRCTSPPHERQWNMLPPNEVPCPLRIAPMAQDDEGAMN